MGHFERHVKKAKIGREMLKLREEIIDGSCDKETLLEMSVSFLKFRQFLPLLAFTLKAIVNHLL